MQQHKHVMATRALSFLPILALTLLPAAHAQTTVTTGQDTVVVDGGFVRITSPEGTTEVSRDWRGTSVRHRSTEGTEVLLDDLGAVRTGHVVRVDLAGDVVFDFASAAIDEAAEATLNKVAQVLRDQAVGTVLVVGHTDSIGSKQSNLRLSQERAVSVMRWLHEEAGIPATMLEARGLGEERPIAANTTADGRDNPRGRARNRRVEIYLGTSEEADVRAAAGLVTVAADSPPVQITNGSVDVGDSIHVDAGGVRVGNLQVTTSDLAGTIATSALGSAAGSENVCAAGRHCTADCPTGGCTMSCSAGAVCNYDCLGGGCTMECASGANCTFGCAGGHCRFSRAVGASWKTSCAGGGCRD